MNEAENPTLQSVLKQKYNIDETMYAEGRFVSLIGDHAPSLVCLGMSMKCLVIARINLSDDIMDYELLSIIPLTVLSLSCEYITQKIKIRNMFKPVQMYQLCSSANQAEVWDNFTSIIQRVQQDKGDIWQVTSLKPVSSDHKFPWSPAKATPYSQIAYQEGIHDVHDYIQLQCPKLSESSVSLPARLPSGLRHWYGDIYPQFYSVNDLNVKFESFVNDVNASNNNIVSASEISLAVEEEAQSGGRISKFFRSLFSCCRCHKKEK
ncbi:hypothetical protein ACF0H5_002533 [Mactra antiquata]